MEKLVAYFDILGVSEKVLNGEFSDAHIRDFAGIVGAMANEHPDFRFAVFSDSVVLSCEKVLVKEFIEVIRELYLNWCGDYLFVRGGIALGEIKWVDSLSDKKFSNLSNLAYARVYGSAFVEAVKLEEKSGPGVLCFASEKAAELIKKSVPYAIFQTIIPILNWIPPEKVSQMLQIFRDEVNSKKTSKEERRHFLATLHFLEQLDFKKG